jgi:(2R)-sulfolactate sulfo-lyase subunit alpha
MPHNVLMHAEKDDVAVAVVDLKPGDTASAVTLDGQVVGSVQVLEAVPLGHKIAMRAMPVDHQVIKYGRPIGQAVQAIVAGAHVHTHNLKTLRW